MLGQTHVSAHILLKKAGFGFRKHTFDHQFCPPANAFIIKKETSMVSPMVSQDFPKSEILPLIMDYLL
jgi:hypothetical protein